MNTKELKFLTVAAVVAVSLGLAGCGGGGGGTTAMPPEEVPDPAIAERMAINTAITTARTAVAGLTDDASDEAISAAGMTVSAAKKAVADAAAVPAAEKAAFTGTIAVIEGNLGTKRTSIMAARTKAAEAMKMANAKLGKDLHAALGGPVAADTTVLDNAAVTLSATGLMVDAAAGAGALPDTGDGSDPDSVTLKAGDSAGSLGGWAGTDYAHTDTGTKVVNEARVYNNKGPGKTVSLSDAGIDVHTDATAGDDIKGYYTVDETADVAKIKGAAFTHSGTQNHTYDSDTEVAFTTRGTFDGAPGVYRCTGTCSSTNDGEGAPSALAGVWHFKPDAGAMVHQPDAHYLYYGWWVSKDKDGKPTAASAFTGRVGTDGNDDGLDPGWTGDYVVTAGSETLTGSATYSGNAAGKFAMTNVLDGTGNGGHFTADAMLNAKFSGTNAGVTGTIDNFRLNDGSDDPGWSVELKRADFGTAGAFAPTDDTTTTDVNESMTATVWSIDGNKAPATGTWSGQMYDEMPGDPPDGDGSDIPTTVTGTFHSEFSTIGRMAGAFGADKE